MITHIVFFKINSNIQFVKTQLLSLKEKLNFIEHLEFGINFSNEARAYDAALVVKLKSKEDLERYANDEEHLSVLANIKPYIKETKVVDFE